MVGFFINVKKNNVTCFRRNTDETLREIIYMPNLEQCINNLISGVEALELDARIGDHDGEMFDK